MNSAHLTVLNKAINSAYRLWKYAVIVSDTNGNLFVKDGDTRCNTADEALDYAASQTTGKARGLVLQDDVLGVWDMTIDAIRRNSTYDPTQIDDYYKKGYDNEIRSLMPLRRRREINFRGQQSLELHPIPKEMLEDPNWRELLKVMWDQKHKEIISGSTSVNLETYIGREYLTESFRKTCDHNIVKFLLAGATGSGKETSTLALLIHLHDVRGYDNTKLNVAVATIPSTISESMNELATVSGMEVKDFGFVDFSRIKVYIMQQWYDAYKMNCSAAAKVMMSERATIVKEVSDIPKYHYDGVVPVLFGGFHDLALKTGDKISSRYEGLEKRIGTLSIGEAHQMLSTAFNKMWTNLNKTFGKKCFKLFVTGTPYDFIYGNAAAEYFNENERALFTRNDLYKDKRTNPNSDFADYPDFNYYKIDVKEIIEKLKSDPNWTNNANGFTWSKLFSYDPESKRFLYEKTVIWLFKRMFGANAFDENGDPLSIYNAQDLCEKAMQHIMVALPAGNKNASAKVYINALKTLLVQHGVFEGEIFDAYDDDLGDRKDDIQHAAGRTITLTCIKDTTGANIPELGSFVFLRDIGDSVKFFEQSTGRVGRKSNGKINCGVFIADLEAAMNIMIVVEEKISIDKGENKSTTQIINETLKNYNFFTTRNGSWIKFDLPDIAKTLEDMVSRGNYAVNFCVKKTTAPTDFNLYFKDTTSKVTQNISLAENGNDEAKNKILKKIKTINKNEMQTEMSRDEHWHNMKKKHIAKIRVISLVYDLGTLQECVKFITNSWMNEDTTVLNIIGKGVEYIPLYMLDPLQINVPYTNRWIDKLNHSKDNLEQLLSLFEDPLLESAESGFIIERADFVKETVRGFLTKTKKSILETSLIFDPVAGKGVFLIYILSLSKELGLDISPENLYYNDIDATWVEFFKDLNKRFELGIPEKNITCSDILTTKGFMKNMIWVGNPPYNPPKGVKVGGGLAEKFVQLAHEHDAKAICYVVPFTWQTRTSSKHTRAVMKKAGLKYFKHLHPDTFDKNVLTNYFICEKGHEGTAVQEVYAVNDVTKYTTVTHNITSDIIPVVRTQQELDFFNEVWKHKDFAFNLKAGSEISLSDSGVVFGYMIGMQKEKLNIVSPMRGMCLKTARVDIEEKYKNKDQRFIQIKDDTTAQQLFDFLNTSGQTFLRCIPRGSSLENWMVLPLLGYFSENIASLAVTDTLFA